MISFDALVASIVPSDKFSVIVEKALNTVRVYESKDSPDLSIRIEFSRFEYPYFYNVHSDKAVSYNEALVEVLNSCLASFDYRNQVSEGIKRITNHRSFVLASNKNTAAKDRNTYIFVDDLYLPYLDINKLESREFMSNFPVQPASEKGVADSCFALGATSLYEAVGYKYDNNQYTSIYPDSSNIPTRLKSFILPSSIRLDNPEPNVFKSGDENTLQCLVLFVEPGRESHVSGEIWVEENKFFGTTFTIPKRNWYIETNLNEGDVVPAKQAIINNQESYSEVPSRAIEITCVEKNPLYMLNKIKYSLNESRITSQTGLKGYSHLMEDIGYLILDDETDPTGQGILRIKPDMICGPSSIKGKVNGIRLAQAAYVAVEKHGMTEGTLDSLDVDLINSLCSEIVPGYWQRPGELDAAPCYYGYVNIAFTDPSVQYMKNSQMSFPFEMLKLAMYEYPKLADAILNSRDEDKLQLTKEIIFLQESIAHNGRVPLDLKVQRFDKFNRLNDPKSPFIGRINSTELLPIINNYLLLKDRPAFVLLTSTGKKIYIPSGNSLLKFESSSNNSFTYDTVVVQLSRLFNNVRNLDGLTNAVSRFILTIGNKAILSPTLYGVNMKQTTLYDNRLTVAIPSSSFKSAQRKIYKDISEDWESEELYGLAIRNPAIWRNMLTAVRVIDGGDVSTIKVSHDVILRMRGDND